MSYDMKKMSNARKKVKDQKVNGKMTSFEAVEESATKRDIKRKEILKEARKHLDFDQMCYFLENGKVNPEWDLQVELGKLPKE